MISILMPIYNGFEYFIESYTSVLQQSYEEWELLLGINGHEENSLIYTLANTIIGNEKRVKIFQYPNIKNKSKTLNELVKISSYDVICLLDVDDIWHKEKLEKQIKYINIYDIIGTNSQYFGSRNDKPFLTLGEINNQIFKNFNTIINSSSMFRKKDAFWDYNFDGVEDYDMWMRLATQNKKFYNLEDVLCYHRIHPTSSFNTKDFSSLIDKLKNIYYNK